MNQWMIMLPIMALALALQAEDNVKCLGNDDIRVEVSDNGRIKPFEVLEDGSWKFIPFRTDEWGTSWYVKGQQDAVTMKRVSNDPNSFEGVYRDIQFGLSYEVSGKALVITATLANKGDTDFQPMTAGLRLGVDSYQESYPDWNNKLVPNVMRCEPTHHWGFAMSPSGQILGWVCPEPVASYSINYAGHRIFTANIDFINQLPLPDRHPQNLHTVKPGEVKKWTVYLMKNSSRESIKQELSQVAKVPIFASDYYTISPGQKTRLSVFGPLVKAMSMSGPGEKTVSLVPEARQDGRTDYAFTHNVPGLYTFRAVCNNGKEAEGSIFVRHPWKWYLERARVEGLRVKPTTTHHAECVYPFFSYFLARKYFPDAPLDKKCEDVFQEYFPQHYDFKMKKLKTDYRIQDSAVWAGILADRFAVTGDEKDLEYASNLVDFLLSRQEEDGGYYKKHKKHHTYYTSVIYLAKSIMEVITEEQKLAKTSGLWKERYERHHKSVARAIADLERRRDNVETEGQQTYEDGMIGCSMTQLAMYALKAKEERDTTKFIEAAEYLFNGHRSLTLEQHPDARVNGSTIRFWETRYTICLMKEICNSPCGWSAWKLYGDYYLYLLTGKENYLREAFNGLGACIQLIDYQSGRLRWGFTPDPFIYARWAVPADKPNDEQEHKWVTGVRGEEYLDLISDWNRSKQIWRPKWGIDNFVHEIFKCMEEIALCNAYVVERPDGSYAGYNCTVQTEGKALLITPLEQSISRVHLNLREKRLVKATISGQSIQNSFSGLIWIGPGGIPEDIRPFVPKTTTH